MEYGKREDSDYPSLRYLLKMLHCWDFAGGPVVKNSPSNAGDTGLVPGQGTKIPPAAGQLSLSTTTEEAQAL